MSLYIATGKETDEGWYGYNTAYIQDGVPCRRIPADGRAVFKYSGDFKNRIGDGVRDAVIRVTYFENGTDGLRCHMWEKARVIPHLTLLKQIHSNGYKRTKSVRFYCGIY